MRCTTKIYSATKIMWHEARRHERKVRGMMVDQRKRAERRRQYYERIQQTDMSQHLRVYGRSMKIHIDPAVSMAANAPQSMMPWNGDTSNMIDRFDVRANLDVMPRNEPVQSVLTPEEITENRKCNYERYRCIVENDCAGVSEEQCLQQIYVDEQFGVIPIVGTTEEEKKRLPKKAAIAFSYEGDASKVTKDEKPAEDNDRDSIKSDDTDVEDADLDITIDVTKLTTEQAVSLNECAHLYGMLEQDFIMMLMHDREELEELREARLLEEQRAQYSGRKSRRERRAYKDKCLQERTISPPSYAAVDVSKPTLRRESSSSSSRSRSREKEKVKFITSFGVGSDEDEGVVEGPRLLRAGSPPSGSAATWPLTGSGDTPNAVTKSVTASSNRPSYRDMKRRLSRSPYSRSRSRSRSARSRSNRSRTRSRSGSRYNSRSKSPIKKKSPEKPAIKRYRRPSLDSSNESGDSETEESKATNQKSPQQKTPSMSVRRDEYRSKEVVATARQKLRRKMQLQISKTFQAERRAELIKQHQKEEERMNREEELRARTLELRRRERERRHQELGDSASGSDSDKERESRRRSRDEGSPRHDRRSGSHPKRVRRFTEERRPSLEKRNDRNTTTTGDPDHREVRRMSGTHDRSRDEPYRERQPRGRDAGRDGYRQGNGDSYRDSRDSYREGNRDNYRDGNRNNYREGNRDSYRDGNRDSYRDGNRDNYRDGNRDNYRDGNRDNYRIGDRDGDRDSYRDGNRDSYRDVDRDNYRDGNRDNFRGGNYRDYNDGNRNNYREGRDSYRDGRTQYDSSRDISQQHDESELHEKSHGDKDVRMPATDRSTSTSTRSRRSSSGSQTRRNTHLLDY